MNQAERKIFAQQERERTQREAEEQRERFRQHVLETYEAEDPVAKWRREADEQTARFAAERQRAKDDERREREHSAVADMQAELGAALAGIADALGVLDDRLRKLERAKKTERKRPAVALPVGPTRSESDPSVRYTQPRIQ
jgi:hypothetical protein